MNRGSELQAPKYPIMSEPITVRGVSDTARWVAYFRALETLRPDALFHDPTPNVWPATMASASRTHYQGNKQEWAWVARTYLFDQFLSRAIQEGADLVVNLAAGLDARPYRMNLPPTLQWIEVDFQDIIAYKGRLSPTRSLAAGWSEFLWIF